MFQELHEATVFGPALVGLFGRQTRIIHDEGQSATKLAHALGANAGKICRLVVASDEAGVNFQQLIVPNFFDLAYADGVVLTEPGSAVVLQSADCPIVILHDKNTGRLVVFHAGRPALTPFCQQYSAACNYTVVENALQSVTQGGSKEAVSALVLGNICGKCFKHESPEARAKAEVFLPLGDHVFADKSSLSLDLLAVIKHRLLHGEVPKEAIVHMGPCTFGTPALTSYRRGDRDTRNTVVVVMR